MGYIFLLISLLAGAAKGYCGKQTGGYVTEYKDAVFANSIRMVLCVLIGLGLIILSGDLADIFAVNCTTLLTALLSGAANSAFVVLWLISVRKGAYMMLDVFCTLGILIPMIGCAILFSEPISAKHIIGVILLLAAVCIMCSYNNSIKSKMSISSFVLLLLCGISNGLSDFSQKLFVKSSENASIAIFNFYTYLFSGIILICCYFAFSKSSPKAPKANIKPIFIYILIMSICLFAYSYFKTLAAQYLPAAQLYPLAQGGALILSGIMSAVFFHERLNLKCITGIVISFAAMCLIVL